MRKNKTNRRFAGKKLLVSALAALTLTAGLAGCKKVTPQEAVSEAVTKTMTESSINNLIGQEKLNKKMTEDLKYSMDYSFTLEEISGEGLDEELANTLAGIGFDVESNMDVEDKKMAGTLDINYGGSTYLSVEAGLADSLISLAVPQLFDGFISIDYDTILEDIKNNPMFADALSMVDESVFEEFTIDELWDAFAESQNLDLESMGIDISDLTDAWESFEDAIEYTELKVKEADLPKEVAAKSAYEIVITEDAYSDLIKEVASFIIDEVFEELNSNPTFQAMNGYTEAPSEEEIDSVVADIADMVGDIEITVAITKDGYLSYVYCEHTIEEVEIELEAMFTGKKIPTDDIAVELTLVNGEEETATFTYDQTFDTKENTIAFEGKFEIEDDEETDGFSFSGEGEYSDVKKGEKYTFDLNFFELDFSDIFSITVSGSMGIDTTDVDTDQPDGKEYSLFDMTQDEFTALGEEIMTNIENDPLFSELLEME